ncbi:hypothetical protein BDY24DRAFT_401133 [Mrakia frigida]|uniref:uncharacterized protein n=1 Tax=Mrakia frigida TaxID=29902 RepID=UPI003FCC14BF
MRFPEALALYKETVLRLGEVMARVAATERRRLERDGGGEGANQDEGRSLREIHDAYRARIALLETEIPPSPTPTVTQESSPGEDPDSGFNGVGSAILSLYQRTDPASPSSSSQGRRTPRPTAASSPSHFDDTPNASSTNGLRRTDSTDSNGSSRSHSRTMSLQTGPSINVEQPTPRPRATSRPVFRSPLPPPAAAPPPPPPLPTSNRYSINLTQGFTGSHSNHSSISSLTNGADPSASSGSQPPTPSTYGGYPVNRHSPPTENGSPLDAEHAAQIRRQSLLESLRAGEEDGGITSFGSMSKASSDRSLAGSFRQQGNHHLEGVRERPESGGVFPPNFNGPTPSSRKSEDTERGMEVLSRTPLQPGFIMDSPVTPAAPSSATNDDFTPRPSSTRASIDSARSNDSRGSRLGRSIKAAVSPRTSIDEAHPIPRPPRSAASTITSIATARERESLVSPRTITGSTGALLASSADDKPFRISATDEGTISQRRKGGPPSLNENTFVPPPSSTTSMSRDSSAQSSFYPSSDASLRAETLPMQRSSSAGPRSPTDGSKSTTTEFGVAAGTSGGFTNATVGAGGGSQSRGTSIFSSTRLRALSQPGRRPSPSSIANEPPRSAAPPVPRSISRKTSFPSSQQHQPISGLPPSSSPSPFAMGRAPSSSSVTATSSNPSQTTNTLHNRLNPPPSLTIQRSVSSSSSLAPRTAASSNGGGLAPSQSILLAASKLHTGIHSPQPPLAPQEILHRPFHLLGLIRLTMYDAGAYLTRKLFVGSEVWSQGGSKLLHLDTKIQVLQGLSFHLEALESVGFSLLPLSKDDEEAGGKKKSPSAAQVGVEFAKMLEEFEGVMDLSRTTLEKKVGSLGPMKPKARGAASLAAWGSKLSRSFDRMANGKNDGSLKAYVDAIEMICIHAQTIDLHLEYFTAIATSQPTSSPYAQLPEATRNLIKTRLTSASQFFGQVVVTIILRDLMILLEKHGKMYGKFIEGP